MDPFSDDAYTAAMKAGVLEPRHLESVGEELRSIRPMKAVFNASWVSRLEGVDNVVPDGHLMDQVERIVEDIERFRAEHGCDRLSMVWCGSTEAYREPSEAHVSIEAFEQALKNDDPAIAPSQLYAYAAMISGVPFANGAPNLTVDVPAMLELADREGVPISGKDFKTGQTLIKTIVAPGIKARSLGMAGWFSTNILGNRDGEVLDAPDNFRSKEVSKLGVLEHILQPELYPELYGDLYHKVRINYYPPRGDDKEGWDNIDIFGWLGYPMQLKIDFLCKDSILAAPLVLDLALLMDLAARADKSGIQEWLSFYYKSPQTAPGLYPENDLFIQLKKLKNTLRHWMGEDLITHLGTEYYE
jgi:myo-inositol-1-phosphate synthase